MLRMKWCTIIPIILSSMTAICQGTLPSIIDCDICQCQEGQADCQDLELYNLSHIRPEGLNLVNLRYIQLHMLSSLTFHFNLQLVSIDLSHNKITSLPKNIFNGLHVLHYLNLSHNSLRYRDMAPQVFTELIQLQVLSLNNQYLKQIHNGKGLFRNMTTLKELHITGTPVIDYTIAHLTNIDFINFGDHDCYMPCLCEQRYQQILKLRKLTRLSFRQCQIYSIDRSFLTSIPQLKRVDFSCNDNAFKSIESNLNMALLPNLEVLLLDHSSGSKGTIDFNKIISKVPNLKALSLAYNAFSSKADTSLSLSTPQLKYLRIENSYEDIATLLDLKLNKHDLTASEEMFFQDWMNLNSLDILDISGVLAIGHYNTDLHCLRPDSLIVNEVYPWKQWVSKIQPNETFTEEFFDNEIFKLLQNPLIEKSEIIGLVIRRLSTYKILRFRHNRLSSKYLLSCRNQSVSYTFYTEQLDLSYTDSAGGMIRLYCKINGPNLWKLILLGCQLVSFTPTLFYGFPSLSVLDLSFNKLGKFLSSSVSEDIFNFSTNVAHLNMSQNGITILQTHLFSKLTHLKTLDLSHNSIWHWHADLNGPQHLALFDLSYNHLEFIEKSFLEELQHMHGNGSHGKLKVYFSNNPIACNCNDESVDFVNWAISTKIIADFSGNIMCQNINKSISFWGTLEIHEKCKVVDAYSPALVSITLVPLTAIMLASFITYIRRHHIFYKWYKWKKKWKRHFYSLPVNIETNEMVKDVYMAVNYYEPLVYYLVSEGIRVYTRDEQSVATGYKWENASNDIEESHAALVVLQEGCLDSSEAFNDLCFCLEKSMCRIITIIIGNDRQAIERNRAVRKLLAHTTVLTWPKVPDISQFQNLKRILVVLDI